MLNLAGIIAGDLQHKNASEAYLLYALYDQDSNRYEVGKQVLTNNASNQHEVLEENLYISEDGFIETFVVNETGEDVWFDDFMVMSTTSPIMQETHYDPWGLELTGIGFQYGGIKANKYLYNGKELIEDNGLEYYDYGARMYDPVVGRWWGVDALTGQMPDWSPYNFGFNSPLRYVDPTGLAPDDWVKDKDGNVRWRENVNSAEDIDPLSGDTYLGKSGVGLDESSGNTQFFNSDGTIDEGVRSMAEFTVTASATSHGKVMSNPVVKDMKANSARIRSEALPFARHMTRSTIDGIGYTGAGISAVGTAVTPFIPHLGVGLLAVGGSVSTISGVASATMNFAEGDISGGFGDVGMMVVGKYGSTLIKNMRNRRRIINWTEQVVLESTLESSLNIADGIRANLQDKK